MKKTLPPIRRQGSRLIKVGASAAWREHQKAIYDALDDLNAAASNGCQDNDRLTSSGTNLSIHKTPDATKVYARLMVGPVRSAMEEATAAMRRTGEL